MAKGFIGASGCKACIGAAKIRKGYIGATQVYSAGNVVTYKVNGVEYTQEYEEGQSVLSPSVVTPTLSGMTFLGWSMSADSPSVMSSLVMEGEPITLYAAFKYADAEIYCVNPNGATWSVTANNNTTEASAYKDFNIATIDTTKYSSGTIYAYGSWYTGHGRGASTGAQYVIGSNVYTFISYSIGWSESGDSAYERKPGYVDYITNIVIPETGNTAQPVYLRLYCTSRYYGASSDINFNYLYYVGSKPRAKIVLTGRTIVG